MMGITITDEGNALEWTKAATDLIEQGYLSLEKEFIFNVYIFALSNIVKIPNSQNYNDTKSVINQALFKLSEKSEITLDDFKECLEVKVKEYFGNKKGYYIVFPINIKFNSLNKLQFTLLNSRIKIRGFNYIKDNFALNELNNRAESNQTIGNYLQTDLTYFIIENTAINNYKAALWATYKFDLLRSIINFCHTYRKSHHPLRAENKPLSLIYSPRVIFTFNSNGDFDNIWWTDTIIDQKKIDFNSSIYKSTLMNSEKIIRRINSLDKNGKKDLLRLICQAFILHSNASDYYEKKWLSFLHFWQILELITLAWEDHLNYDDIINRNLSFIKEEYHEPIKQMLSAFKRKRNNFVHKSDFIDFDMMDINTIKVHAEISIMHLIKNAGRIKNKENLRIYFNIKKNKKQDIKTMKSILALVEKEI